MMTKEEMADEFHKIIWNDDITIEETNLLLRELFQRYQNEIIETKK